VLAALYAGVFLARPNPVQRYAGASDDGEDAEYVEERESAGAQKPSG
jgi:hypothetical protein